MAALVVIEHVDGDIREAARSAVSAALGICQRVDVLVLECGRPDVAPAAAKLRGVARVLLAEAPHFEESLPEPVAEQIATVASSYSHVIAAATSFGNDVLPRVAAMLGCEFIENVTHIESEDVFRREIFSGKVVLSVRSCSAIKFVTVQGTKFEAAGFDEDSAPIVRIEVTRDPELSSRLASNRPDPEYVDLTKARIVVSGGRGVGSAESFGLIEALAKRLNAAVGASRAAVEAGFAPAASQVGQSGKTVAPDLYFAIGISGADQHVVGMKDSRLVVAINRDIDAPIFKAADYGLVGDLRQIIPELLALLD